MNKKILSITTILLFCILAPFWDLDTSRGARDLSVGGTGGQCKSRYATLQYTNSKVLKEFDNELCLGRSLKRSMSKKNIVTTEDETIAKIDTIIEKAMVVLDMYPNKMHIKVVVVPNKKAIAQIYQQKYGKRVGFVAYYSLGEDTIYVSADHGNLEVVSHEIGHAIVDHFFEVRPPYNIHEMMAQFTSKHIND